MGQAQPENTIVKYLTRSVLKLSFMLVETSIYILAGLILKPIFCLQKNIKIARQFTMI